ncbi:hypothetical protein [uncultured Jannaschia sp.]|uniref:hypothetical protein n=1 Tax=uncultured Jannaschia sp. TaxID=293347 RepID=UPI002604BBCD|nr:hypothetical protein [uncultured Jannaschia sp.]
MAKILEPLLVAFLASASTVWLSSWYVSALRSDDIEIERHVRDLARVARRIERYWLYHIAHHDPKDARWSATVNELARKVTIADSIVVRHHDDVTRNLPGKRIRKARRRYAEGYMLATGGPFASPSTTLQTDDGLDRLTGSLEAIQDVIAELESERVRRGRFLFGAARMLFIRIVTWMGIRYIPSGYHW